MVFRRAGRVAGLDLLFAAPKSVSVAHGLAPPELAAALSNAHDRAVAGAIGYLEAHACVVRQGPTGRATGAGFVAAGFRHRTSRADDPHLHTHVVTANMAAGPDGRWSALHTPVLFAELRATGAVYHAALRHEADRLDLAWTDAGGRWELAGVPRAVIEVFSQRRAQLLVHLAAQGQRTGRAGPAATAARSTRPPKVGLVDYPVLVADWHGRAAAVGFDLDQGLACRPATAPPDAYALQGLGDVFRRADVVRAWADHLPQGASPGELERAAVVGLRDGCVPLPPREGIGRWDGPVRATRYTSTSVLALRETLAAEPVSVVTGSRLVWLDAIGRLRASSSGLVVAAARGPAAASDFEAATGIPAAPAAAVVEELGRRRGWSAVVVAEAERWATAPLVTLIGAARAAGAEVVLAGDPDGRGPLPSAFSAMLGSARRLGLAPVDVPDLAATVPAAGGTLTLASGAGEARRLLVADWAARRGAGQEAVMVARSPEEVAALNAMAGPGLDGAVGAVLAGEAWRSGAAEAHVLGVRVPFRSRAGDAPVHRYAVCGSAIGPDSGSGACAGSPSDRWATAAQLDDRIAHLSAVLGPVPAQRQLVDVERRLHEARRWQAEVSRRSGEAPSLLASGWTDQAAKADREVMALERQHHHMAKRVVDWQQWTAAHASEVADLARLRAQAGLRVEALARAAELSTPAWLIEGVGRVPRGPLERVTWRDAARAVVAYRERWHIEDWSRALGPERLDRSQAERADRTRVEQVLRRACPQRRVERDGPGFER
jgi:conjugative relaxase-like TrwC/TraI family protein